MLLTARKYFFVLLFFCILFLYLPLFIRENYTSGLLLSSESYKSLFLVEELRNQGLSFNELLLFDGLAWYTLLSFSPLFLVTYLPFLFGILCFILFYLLIDLLRPELRGLASSLLIISPPFLYLFSIASKYTGALFFVLLGFYFIFKNKHSLGIFFIFISGFFSLFSFFIVSLVLLIYFYKNKHLKFSLFLLLFIFFLFGSFLVYLLFLDSSLFNLRSPPLFSLVSFFSLIFFEFGGYYGLSFFMFLLCLAGIYLTHKEKYVYLLYFFVFAFFLFLGFYFHFLLPYLAFLFAYYAALGLRPLFSGVWKSELFKYLTTITLICGLLFSLIVFYKIVGNLEPTPSFFESLTFLKNKPEHSVVFADSRVSSYLKYSGKIGFINTLSFPDWEILLEATNITLATSLIEKNNITYFLIDKNLKERSFHNKDEKLFFLLHHSPDKFVRIFNNSVVDLWEYKPLREENPLTK